MIKAKCINWLENPYKSVVLAFVGKYKMHSFEGKNFCKCEEKKKLIFISKQLVFTFNGKTHETWNKWWYIAAEKEFVKCYKPQNEFVCIFFQQCIVRFVQRVFRLLNLWTQVSTYVSASIFKACAKCVVVIVVVVVITCTIIQCASITIVICLSSGKEMIDIQWMRRRGEMVRHRDGWVDGQRKMDEVTDRDRRIEKDGWSDG